MPLYGKVSGTWQTATAPYAKVSGVWQPLTAAYARVSGVWQQVYAATGPLSANLAPGSVSGSGVGSGPITTDRCTTTASGGTAPYTYHWEYVSGDATLSPNDSNILNPYFTASGTAPETKTGAWRCLVTDAVAVTAYTGNVSISIEFQVPELSVSLNTTGLYGIRFGLGTGNATTDDSVTATPSGGQAPYSYDWEYVSGDVSIFPFADTSATTNFHRSGAPTHQYFATWRCKVTDNLSTVVYTDNVDIELDFETGA